MNIFVYTLLLSGVLLIHNGGTCLTNTTITSILRTFGNLLCEDKKARSNSTKPRTIPTLTIYPFHNYMNGERPIKDPKYSYLSQSNGIPFNGGDQPQVPYANFQTQSDPNIYQHSDSYSNDYNNGIGQLQDSRSINPPQLNRIPNYGGGQSQVPYANFLTQSNSKTHQRKNAYNNEYDNGGYWELQDPSNSYQSYTIVHNNGRRTQVKGANFQALSDRKIHQNNIYSNGWDLLQDSSNSFQLQGHGIHNNGGGQAPPELDDNIHQNNPYSNNLNNGGDQLQVPSNSYQLQWNGIHNNVEGQTQVKGTSLQAQLDPNIRQNNPYNNNYNSGGDPSQVPSNSYQPQRNGIPNNVGGQTQNKGPNFHAQSETNIHQNHDPSKSILSNIGSQLQVDNDVGQHQVKGANSHAQSDTNIHQNYDPLNNTYNNNHLQDPSKIYQPQGNGTYNNIRGANFQVPSGPYIHPNKPDNNNDNNIRDHLQVASNSDQPQSNGVPKNGIGQLQVQGTHFHAPDPNIHQNYEPYNKNDYNGQFQEKTNSSQLQSNGIHNKGGGQPQIKVADFHAPHPNVHQNYGPYNNNYNNRGGQLQVPSIRYQPQSNGVPNNGIGQLQVQGTNFHAPDPNIHQNYDPYNKNYYNGQLQERTNSSQLQSNGMHNNGGGQPQIKGSDFHAPHPNVHQNYGPYNNYNNRGGQLQVPSISYQPQSNGVPNNGIGQLLDQGTNFHAPDPNIHQNYEPYNKNYNNGQFQERSNSSQLQSNGIHNKGGGQPQIKVADFHAPHPNIHQNYGPYNNNYNNRGGQLQVPSISYQPQSNGVPNNGIGQLQVQGTHFHAPDPNIHQNYEPYNKNYYNGQFQERTNSSQLQNNGMHNKGGGQPQIKGSDFHAPHPNVHQNYGPYNNNYNNRGGQLQVPSISYQPQSNGVPNNGIGQLLDQGTNFHAPDPNIHQNYESYNKNYYNGQFQERSNSSQLQSNGIHNKGGGQPQIKGGDFHAPHSNIHQNYGPYNNNYNNKGDQLHVPSINYQPQSNGVPNNGIGQLQVQGKNFHAPDPNIHQNYDPYNKNYYNGQLQERSNSSQLQSNGMHNKGGGQPQIKGSDFHAPHLNIHQNYGPYNNNCNNRGDHLHVPSISYQPQSNEVPNNDKGQLQVQGTNFQTQSISNIPPNTNPNGGGKLHVPSNSPQPQLNGTLNNGAGQLQVQDTNILGKLDLNNNHNNKNDNKRGQPQVPNTSNPHLSSDLNNTNNFNGHLQSQSNTNKNDSIIDGGIDLRN